MDNSAQIFSMCNKRLFLLECRECWMLCVLCSSPTDDTDLHGGYAGCYLFEHGTHGNNRNHAVRLYLTTNLTNPTNLFSDHGLNGLNGCYAVWCILKKNQKHPLRFSPHWRAPCTALMSLLMKASSQRNAITALQVVAPPENRIERKQMPSAKTGHPDWELLLYVLTYHRIWCNSSFWACATSDCFCSSDFRVQLVALMTVFHRPWEARLPKGEGRLAS